MLHTNTMHPGYTLQPKMYPVTKKQGQKHDQQMRLPLGRGGKGSCSPFPGRSKYTLNHKFCLFFWCLVHTGFCFIQYFHWVLFLFTFSFSHTGFCISSHSHPLCCISAFCFTFSFPHSGFFFHILLPLHQDILFLNLLPTYYGCYFSSHSPWLLFVHHNNVL